MDMRSSRTGRTRWSGLILAVQIVLLFLGTACSSPSPRKKLEKADIPFTADAFVREAGLGNTEAVGWFIDAEMDVNSPAEGGTSPFSPREGTTPLHAAVQLGRIEVIELLLDAGADVNLTTSSGDTALILAGRNGNSAVIGALLERGGSVEIDARDVLGRTALMNAATSGPPPPADSRRLDAVSRLLEAGADVNLSTTDGMTALRFAVDRGFRRIEEALLAAGAADDRPVLPTEEDYERFTKRLQELRDAVRRSDITAIDRFVHPDHGYYVMMTPGVHTGFRHYPFQHNANHELYARLKARIAGGSSSRVDSTAMLSETYAAMQRLIDQPLDGEYQSRLADIESRIKIEVGERYYFAWVVDGWYLQVLDFSERCRQSEGIVPGV